MFSECSNLELHHSVMTNFLLILNQILYWPMHRLGFVLLSLAQNLGVRGSELLLKA